MNIDQSKTRRRVMRERNIRIRNARYMPRGRPEETTLGVRIPGTLWRCVEHTNNMHHYYHDSFPSTNGYNMHITIVFNDSHGKVRNGRIDVHSTLWRGSGQKKIHYGWCTDANGNEVWRDLDPRVSSNKMIIALLHQFHFDKRAFFSVKTYRRMRLPKIGAIPLSFL